MDIKVATRQCTDQLGRALHFHYFLTVDTLESEHTCLEEYGVRITQEAGDSVAIPAITTSAVRIDELMTLLVDNQVGPTGLEDVLADWL